MAEQLVANLAGAFVCQSGFNATQAGSRTRVPSELTRSVNAGRAQVLSNEGFLLANLKETLSELNNRLEFREVTRQITEGYNALSRDVREDLQILRRLEASARPFDEIRREIAIETERVKQEIDELLVEETAISRCCRNCRAKACGAGGKLAAPPSWVRGGRSGLMS